MEHCTLCVRAYQKALWLTHTLNIIIHTVALLRLGIYEYRKHHTTFSELAVYNTCYAQKTHLQTFIKCKQSLTNFLWSLGIPVYHQ